MNWNVKKYQKGVVFMEVIVNGETLFVELGLVKEIKQSSIVFVVQGKDIEIEVNKSTKISVQEMLNDDEDVLLALDMETKTVILDATPVDRIE